MDINKLVDDIIILVARNANNDTSVSLAEWKLKLPLVAVCRRWRTMLLPYVYNQVLVVFRNNDKRVEQLKTRQLTEFVPFHILENNAELIISNSGVNYAKSLSVHVKFHKNWGIVIQKVPTFLDLDNTVWDITALSFTYNNHSMLGSISDDTRSKFVDACKNGLPQLSTLAISTPVTKVDSLFYDLAAHYAKSLSYLKLNCRLALESLEFTSKLTRLDISTKNLENQPPLIDVDSLRTLCLFDVRKDYNWSFFAKTPGNFNVVLPSLTHLCVNHLDEGGLILDKVAYSSDLHLSCQLSFPNLEIFEAYNCPSDITALHNAHFPRYLNTVKLSGLNGGLKNLDSFTFTKIGNMEVNSFDELWFYGISFLHDAKYLLNGKYKTNKMTLFVKDCFSIDTINMPNWSSLTRVVIQELTSVSDLAVMISYLSKDCDIVVLGIKAIAAGSNEADPITWASASTVESRIKGIRIGYSSEIISAESVALLVGYMMTRVRPFPLLVVSTTLLMHLDTLVVQYMDEFPHMLDVEMINSRS